MIVVQVGPDLPYACLIPSAAHVSRKPGGFELSLDEPAYGVARGQAAVLYEGDAVVGSGLITSASYH